MKAAHKQYFSREDLGEAIKYFDEIAFSQRDRNDESHDFKIDDGEGDRFVIQKAEHERFRIVNSSPDGHKLYVDNYCLSPGESVEPENSAFIYDKEFSDSSQEGPSFIYGINPHEPEIWRLNPDDRGCSVRAKDFTKKFKIGPDKYVGVEKITFDIRPAEFVGIYGKSGTGKTVLIESLLAPSQTKGGRSQKGMVEGGELLIDEKAPKYSSDCVAFLPQHIQFPKQIKCKELLKLGCADRKNSSWYSAPNIQTLLKLCTLSPDILNERCGRLSGGQQRRLALAMALLNPKIRLLIADEPTSGLDIANEMEIMRTFRRLSRSKGITVVVVTHAVAALALFDRVMVLRKENHEIGAALSFDSLWVSHWEENSLPQIFRDSIRQDAERIAFLSSGKSALQMPGCESTKYVWPFRFGKYFAPPKISFWGKVKYYALIPGLWIKDTFSAPVFSQYLGWTKNSAMLILRQRKSLLIFIIMAICCALSIQIGVSNGVSGNVNLLTLMALCAPWLCATYATVFTSELLSLFAWEKFSGLRARGFTFGVLAGLLLPSCIIALVFTTGLFLRMDNGWLGQQGYKLLTICKADKARAFFLSEKEQAEFGKQILTPSWNANHKPKAIPPQYIIGMSELGTRSQGDSVFKSDEDARSFKDQKRDRTRNDLISPATFFLRQWFILFLICAIGTSMGVASIAIFRDVKSATISLVILFIAFMVFSRAFINQESYMYALLRIPSGELEWHEIEWLPPIIISFLGIGRYVFNVLSYPIKVAFLWDWIPLFIWWVISVTIAQACFASKTKNWRMISR